MTEIYGSWSVKQLKYELRKRNAKCVGKKEALIERLLAYDRNLNFAPVNSIQVTEETEYHSCPWPPNDYFTSVKYSSIVPLIDIIYINQYFFDIYKEREGMSMYAAVHRKGYNMMKEKFLVSLAESHLNDIYFYQGQVNSEMTKNLTYFVRIVIHKEGSIREGSCECVAGKGPKSVCKHLATVLYAILHFKEHNVWCLRKTCTDEKQVWHMPKKFKLGISPTKAEQIKLTVHTYNSQKKEIGTNMCFDSRPNRFQNMPSFKSNARSIAINYSSKKRRTLALCGGNRAINMSGYINDHDYLAIPLSHQIIYNRIKLNSEDIKKIEKCTRSQRNSSTWYTERSLRVTASHVGTIVHMTERRNRDLFVDSIINPKCIKSVQMEWGINNKKNAIESYKKLTTNEVILCGLCVSPEHCYLAGSPDGLIASLTVLEVKCPYSIRNTHITADNLDYLEVINGELQLKKSSNYYYQVQTQMLVTGRDFCDFVVWTQVDFKCISVLRNNEVIDQLIIPKTKYFYDKFMVPALYNKFYA